MEISAPHAQNIKEITFEECLQHNCTVL